MPGRRHKTNLPPEIQLNLPPEIPLFHILPKLPLKSVFRFTCVSRQWHSFIKTPEFVKLHLRHVTTSGGDHHNHHKLLLLYRDSTARKFYTVDCESLEDRLSLHRSIPFNTGRFYRIAASFHGLVCLAIYKNCRTHRFHDMVLWNPSTGDHKTLSRGSAHQEYYDDSGGSFALYYASSDDDYRLLRVTSSYGVYIYSLKSDSWRKLDPTCMAGVERRKRWSTYAIPKTVTLNDKLYMWKNVGIVPSVIRFDVKTEEFKEIGAPSSIQIGFWSVRDVIVVLKGRVHLFAVSEDLKSTELWRMDGDDERWTQLGSCCVFPIGICIELELSLLVRNANWLVDLVATSGTLCERDRKTLVGKFVSTYSRFDVFYMIDFVATLVSPNQYIS